MPDEDTTDDLDELFGSLGLDNKPITPEDLFINEELTQLKIDTMRYWLNHEMHRYYKMVREGIVPCRIHLAEGSKVPLYRPVTALEYGTEAIDYYLDMKHLPWFTDLHNRKALDKKAIIKRIVTIESVKKVMESPYKH